MKVYVVTLWREGEDEPSVDCVFSEKKEVENYIVENDSDYHNFEFTECILDEKKIDKNKNYGFYIKIYKDKEIKSISKVDDDDLKSEKGYIKIEIEDSYGRNKKLYLVGVFVAKSKAEAIRAAEDKVDKLVKNNEWCYKE